jgi:hypothetical protein
MEIESRLCGSPVGKYLAGRKRRQTHAAKRGSAYHRVVVVRYLSVILCTCIIRAFVKVDCEK